MDDSPTMPTPLPTVAPPASSTPLPTVESIAESTAIADVATHTPQPTPTSAPEPLPVISGQIAEGAFFLGAPDAPVTVIDYSDFL